jgi:peptidoglycan hydrolase-like protein with peptidoglycan-binding domain
MWEVVGEALVDDPTASAPEPAAAPGEAPGTAVDLREVQSLLAAQGFDPGPVDGVAGSRTEGAIRAFQEEDGLAVDGRASARLLQRLRLARIARQMALVRSDPEAFPPFAVSRPAPPLDPW